MTNTFRKIYKKTGSTGTSTDYELTGVVGVNGVELDIMKGASRSSDGEIGLVPKPTSGQEDYLLTGGGVWLSQSSLLGDSDISYLGDGTVKGAISRVNAKGLKWVSPNIPEEITIPSKGIKCVQMNVPKLTNNHIVSVSLIGARTTSYMAQVTLLGYSRQGITDNNVYLFFYNNYTASLSNTYQVMIWYTDSKMIEEDLDAEKDL